MNKKTKIISALALAAIGSTALAACGGNNPGGSSTPSSTSSSAYEVTIVVEDEVADNLGLNKKIREKQKAFEAAHPTIQVKHKETQEQDFSNQLKYVKQQFDVKSEDAPTMLVVNTNEFARQLYDDGYTKPLPNFAQTDYAKDLYEDVLSGYTYGDKVVGFPVDIETPMIGFNKKILEARKNELQGIGQDYKNLDISTWAKYSQVIETLTYTSGESKQIYGMGVTALDYYQTFGVWANANGFDGVIQNSDGTISINFANNDSMKTTINLINSLLKKECIYQSAIDARNADYFNYIWTGKFASFTYYPQWANWFQSSGKMGITDIDVYNVPAGPNATESTKTNTIYSRGYVMSKNATDAQIEACVAYLNYMYSADTWKEKVNYAYENYCDFVSFPTIKSVDLKKVYENIDETTGDNHYSNAIKASLSKGFVSKINSVAYTLEIRGQLSDLFKTDPDKPAELVTKLQTLETTTKANWLDAYNARKRG